MKKVIALLFYSFMLSGCKKEIPEPLTDTSVNSKFGPTFNEYNITFFTNNFNAGGSFSVSINGQAQTLTYAYNYNPGCGAMGCANFTLPPGTYTYAGGSTGNQIGKIVTGPSQCITICLQ